MKLRHVSGILVAAAFATAAIKYFAAIQCGWIRGRNDINRR